MCRVFGIIINIHVVVTRCFFSLFFYCCVGIPTQKYIYIDFKTNGDPLWISLRLCISTLIKFYILLNCSWDIFVKCKQFLNYKMLGGRLFFVLFRNVYLYKMEFMNICLHQRIKNYKNIGTSIRPNVSV